MDNNYIGKKVDNRYEVISLVGVGGMSNVYKAIDTATGNTVAIKFLKHEFFENEELVRRFKNESKAISLLDNPNIIKVIDVNIGETEKYIVVEYIDGITLKEYIDNRKILTWQETVQFTGTILAAIGHAHDNGIIHRDLKPQNVMLLRDGTLKIMDFGIARLSTAGQKTVTDKAIGSVHYISPEQVRGKNSDGRSDIYSIGIMMYEMLTGKLPFVSDSAVSVAMKQVSDTARKPSEIVETIPQGLEQIVLKAIEKNANDRYQSASEMLKDINEFRLNPAVVFDYGNETEKTQVVPVKKKPEKKTVPTKKAKVKKGFRLTLPVMAGIAAAFAVSSLVAIFLIFKLSGNALVTSHEDIDLPNFIGMTESEVKASGYKLKFNIDYAYSSEYEEGVVFTQTPKPPKSIKENSTVTLRVSKGPQTTQLPELANYARTDAEKILSEMDVNVSIVTVSDKDIGLGYIIKTDPSRGTIVKAGSTVTIYVSRGDDDDRNKTYVPNVVGQTSLDEAKKVLAKNNLRVGSYTLRTSEAPEGTVLEQNPEPGTELIVGGAVDLVISSGLPKCEYCESTDHLTEDHPRCDVCGSRKHEKHPKCDICGERTHDPEDHCSYCEELGHSSSNCPKKKADEEAAKPTPEPEKPDEGGDSEGDGE
ncbi:MAG: Stk1 family PASTA domain-containing Ser/Thr kinase [Oscillospiraceae bacterium]|nr:Stk1 family PASTA domain-containing Ser/Thr kinase [Oscillospiraceae bacterium]